MLQPRTWSFGMLGAVIIACGGALLGPDAAFAPLRFEHRFDAGAAPTSVAASEPGEVLPITTVPYHGEAEAVAEVAVPAGRLAGRVVGQDDQPVPFAEAVVIAAGSARDAWKRLLDEASGAGAGVVSDEEGRFEAGFDARLGPTVHVGARTSGGRWFLVEDVPAGLATLVIRFPVVTKPDVETSIRPSLVLSAELQAAIARAHWGNPDRETERRETTLELGMEPAQETVVYSSFPPEHAKNVTRLSEQAPSEIDAETAKSPRAGIILPTLQTPASDRLEISFTLEIGNKVIVGLPGQNVRFSTTVEFGTLAGSMIDAEAPPAVAPRCLPLLSYDDAGSRTFYSWDVEPPTEG